jgi:hypothetical protein
MNFDKLSAADFKRASQIKSQIEKLETQLASILSKATHGASNSSAAPQRKRKKMSRAAKAKIAAAQKRRWQERKSQMKKK